MKFKIVLSAMLFVQIAFAQAPTPPDNWFNLDPTTDKVPGVSSEKAYKELLKGRKSSPIIVGVLDSGVDTEHEDLKDIIWVNSDEIPSNGIDDDKNGYVDDYNGWNFIGGRGGNHISTDNLEITRVYRDLYARFNGKTEAQVSKKDKPQWERWVKVKETFEAKLTEAQGLYDNVMKGITAYESAFYLVKALNNGGEINKSVLDKMKEQYKDNEAVKTAIAALSRQFASDKVKEEDIAKRNERYKEYVTNQTKYQLNCDYEPRWLVGDDYKNSKERFYGNNSLEGPDAGHGTHVAGIIGAIRNNGKGMDGVADNVRIMVVRCVPDGDERDKDVANSIRYAADNGAKILNMSFGKNWGYDKKAVDEAMKYAEKKGVLLVHAAGNDAFKMSDVEVYPNYMYNNDPKKQASNWITVGACDWHGGEQIAAEFSNYGKNEVDIFSPGVDITSTTPRNNYESYDGTSMASPVVAGCAALLWSYFPQLTVAQVRDCIVSTAVPVKGQVTVPGLEEKLPMTDLCKTGGVVNVYEAIKKAISITEGK